MLELSRRAPAPVCSCFVVFGGDSRDPEVGPYAKYLIHQGMRKEEALEAARTIDAGQAEASRAVQRRHSATAAR